MEKFRVGDIVIGNAKATIHYIVTKEGYIAEVLKLKGDRMEIQKLGEVGSYNVHQNCFDLYNTFPEDVQALEAYVTSIISINRKGKCLKK